MANLVLKPSTGAGNSVIIKDQGGGSVLTTADSGAEINNVTSITASGNLTIAGDLVPATPLSHRNMIINGDMQISQRGTTFTGLGDGSVFTLDRWKYVDEGTTDSRITISQNSTTPTGQGFGKALYVDVTTADTSLDSGHIHYLRYAFEGQDLQQLAYGSSSAKSMTLSFWVKSPKTGIHVVSLKGDYSSNNRMVSGTYTIATADTWEKHTITFPGDTSGTIANDNSAELDIHFYLSAGSSKSSGTLSTTWIASVEANRAVGQVNLMDNTSNNFYITGVQLELGSSATPFEHRSYGDELARCHRYYWRWSAGTYPYTAFAPGQGYSGSQANGVRSFPTTMRTAPSFSVSSDSHFWWSSGAGNTVPSDIEQWGANEDTSLLIVNCSATAGYGGYIRAGNSTAAYAEYNAEL